MTDKINALLPKIKHHSIFSKHDFRLVGGTAMSYHLGHRISEDLDLFYLGDLPGEAIEEFVEHCISELGDAAVVYVPNSNEMLEDFAIGGGDANDHLQTWMIGGVKVQFVDGTSALSIRKFFEEDNFTKIGDIKIAALETIFKMKSLMFYKRTKSRDLFDMIYFFSMGNQNYSLEATMDLIKTYERLYHSNEVLHEFWVQSFLSKRYDPLRDEGLAGLAKAVPGYHEMREAIADAVKGDRKGLDKLIGLIR